MKITITIIFVFVGYCLSAQNVEINKVHSLYFEGWTDECGANSLVDYLSQVTLKDKPVFKAYKGASIATTANCELMPWKKLKNFNEGKHYIESAVRDEPENLEIRFIRFTIQTNIPPILNYDNMEEDKNFILKNLNLQTYSKINNYLFKEICDFMTNSKLISEDEKRQLDLIIAKL